MRSGAESIPAGLLKKRRETRVDHHLHRRVRTERVAHLGAERHQIIEILHAIVQQICQPLLVILDGLPAHRSALVRECMKVMSGAVQVEQLPAYAPELNPLEYILGHLKHHELTNRCAA